MSALLAFASLVSIAAAAPPSATGPDLSIGLKKSDIDLEACKAFVDGKEAEGDFKNGILATLGLVEGKPWTADLPP